MPPQTPEDVKVKVETYLRSEFEKLKTKSTLESIVMEGSGLPWVENYEHYNYQAAKNATEVSILKKTNNAMTRLSPLSPEWGARKA